MNRKTIAFLWLLVSAPTTACAQETPREAANATNVTEPHEKDDAFLEAIRKGDKEIVMRLLESGSNVNAKNVDGKTALMIAIEGESIDIVELLLARGAHVNIRETVWGWTPLMFASVKGNQKIVRLLLDKGADANAKDNDGDTALMFAASNARAEVVDALVEKGADVRARDKNGMTALHRAAIEGCSTCVEILLAKGSDINDKDSQGNTPLSLALEEGHFNLAGTVIDGLPTDIISKLPSLLIFAVKKEDAKLVTKLLRKGIDANTRDSDGFPVLAIAAGMGNIEIVKILLKYGADVNAKKAGGWKREGGGGETALVSAVRLEHKEIVKILLENGADANAEDLEGFPILAIAARLGNIEIVKILLKYGADVNAKRELHYFDENEHSDELGEWGETALLLAVREKHYDIVRILLEKGADPNIGTSYVDSCGHSGGESPLDLAVKYGDEKLLKLLMKHGGNLEKISMGAREYLVAEGDVSMMRFVLRHGGKLGFINEDGESEVTIAAMRGDVEVLRLSLGDVGYGVPKVINGGTAIDNAANLEIVELLLEHGYGVNIDFLPDWMENEAIARRFAGKSDDRFRKTALLIASFIGHKDIVRDLISKGVDVNAVDRRGKSALMIAAQEGHIEIVKYLFDKGADITLKILKDCESDAGDDCGQTALSLAERNGHKDIVEFLSGKAGAVVNGGDQQDK